MARTVTSKGQVTIPKAVRDHLGIEPGAAVSFDLDEQGRVILTRTDGAMPISRFAALRGSAGPGQSTDDIMRLLRGEPSE